MTKIRGLRWWVVALISLGTIINYLSRNALGVLAPTLKDQMGISTEQYSYIVGAFQIGYTIMQPVCGLIVDAIGLRLGFALFAALWSIAGCLQGGVTGWLSLAGARGLMGLTEAAAIPAGMKAVAEWFPDKEKSIAVGFFNVGTSLGALIAPPLVAAVTLTLRLALGLRRHRRSRLFLGGALVRLLPPAERARLAVARRARADPVGADPPGRKRPEALGAGTARDAALLGDRDSALLRRTGVADVQLLDPPLPGDRAAHGPQADRSLRVAAVPRGGLRRRIWRLCRAVPDENFRRHAGMVAHLGRRSRRAD